MATGLKAFGKKCTFTLLVTAYLYVVILENIVRKVNPASRYKLVVVDPASVKILSAAVKLPELLDEGVMLIEDIQRRRTPYTKAEAIYFVTPTADTVNRIIEDFTRSKSNREGKMYAAIHLYFISALDDRLFHKLKASSASSYIRTLQEVYLDYIILESQVFLFQREHSLLTFFGSEVAVDQVNREFAAVAQQLASFCISLGEFPFIRYASQNGSDKIAGRLAGLLYEELDKYTRLDTSYPSAEISAVPQNLRTTLLIVDRTVDTISPLLHEFTYQAMANDLLRLSDNGTRYKYTIASSAEGNQDKEILLDETTDPLWASVRHIHIAECINTIIGKFNKFLSENRAAAGSRKDGVTSLKELKETLTAVPQFQDLKAKFSVHINMAQECMLIFQRTKLADVGNVEQTLATGETADGSSPKNIEIDLIPLLDDPNVPKMDKIRLLMLYIIGKEGVRDTDRRQLLDHAQATSEETNAITNLALLGVKLSQTGKHKDSRKKNQTKKAKKRDDDVPYDLSRYTPAIKNISEALAEGTLSDSNYPYVRDPRQNGTYGSKNLPSQSGGAASSLSAAASAAPVTSLRSTKPSWHNRKNGSDATAALASSEKNLAEEKKKNGRLIIFVLGGLTYSEMRTAYEVGETSKKDVIIGSTHLLTPNRFVEDLKQLRKPFTVPDMNASSNDNHPARSASSSNMRRNGGSSRDVHKSSGSTSHPKADDAGGGGGKKFFGLFGKK